MSSPPTASMIRFALYAGLADMEASIRRTILGPLWSTLGLAFLVSCLGLFFGTVLRQQLPDINEYIPFLAAGMIAWTFMASCVHQSCGLVWTFLNMLRHNRMTLLVPVLRVMIRNFVILLLNIALALIAAWLLLGGLPVAPLALIGGILLLLLNTFWMSYLGALACARFRDLPQLIAWGMHLAFFLTPILWVEYNLGRFDYLVDYNPFAHLTALLRRPLLGQDVGMEIWLATALLAILGLLLSWWFGRITARRLPYWL